ncbi:alpha-L-fucosidase [Pseudoroseicyclus sp. H15]
MTPHPAPPAHDLPAPLSPEKKAWFTEARFGLFIHWGLYALPARHEWVAKREEIAAADYARYFERFDPQGFDPAAWAAEAKAAGMGYVVITAKHHEGFCLWDSALTDYKATNTPFGRDALAEIVAAFRAKGIRIGLYYSLIDWHHPDFTIDPIHPERGAPDAVAQNASRDMARYRAYMLGQIEELLTGYGPIDIIWFDFSYPHREENGLRGKGREDWGSEALIAHVRKLAPDILINNRVDLPELVPDVVTPEQYVPNAWPTRDGERVTWEACHTLAGPWGYSREAGPGKSGEQLLRILVDTVSKGGNLLMNVGPTARGEFDAASREALETYARWMALHGEAIIGAGAAEIGPVQDCRVTQRGNLLYLHVLAWPFRHLHLPGLAGKVAYAELMADGSEIRTLVATPDNHNDDMQIAATAGDLVLELPVARPDVVIPVIKLELT